MVLFATTFIHSHVSLLHYAQFTILFVFMMVMKIRYWGRTTVKHTMRTGLRGLQGRHRRKMHEMPLQMVHYKWYVNFVTKSLNTCGKTISVLFMRVAMTTFHSTLKMGA